MATHWFSVEIAAPLDRVFDLWANLDRWYEWIEGVAKVTDATGLTDRVQTRYSD